MYRMSLLFNSNFVLEEKVMYVLELTPFRKPNVCVQINFFLLNDVTIMSEMALFSNKHNP